MRSELSLSVVFLHPKDDQIEAWKLSLHKREVLKTTNCPYFKWQQVWQTLLCFSRQSYCEKLREIFFLQLKLFQFLAVCLEVQGNANTRQERSKITTLYWESFFFLFFPDMKATPFSTKYTMDWFLEGAPPHKQGTSARNYFTPHFGGVFFFLNTVTFHLNFGLQS